MTNALGPAANESHSKVPTDGKSAIPMSYGGNVLGCFPISQSGR